MQISPFTASFDFMLRGIITVISKWFRSYSIYGSQTEKPGCLSRFAMLLNLSTSKLTVTFLGNGCVVQLEFWIHFGLCRWVKIGSS